MLVAIQGEYIVGVPFKDALDRLKTAGRPLTLTFSQPEGGGSSPPAGGDVSFQPQTYQVSPSHVSIQIPLHTHAMRSDSDFAHILLTVCSTVAHLCSHFAHFLLRMTRTSCLTWTISLKRQTTLSLGRRTRISRRGETTRMKATCRWRRRRRPSSSMAVGATSVHESLPLL